ncbi:hypothetical protein ACQU2S_002759 [Klebsiella michiganensis]
MEKEAACWRACINAVGQAAKMNSPLLQFRYQRKEVTYAAKRLVSLSDAGAQVLFDVYVGDSVTPGEHYHMFSYSGAGNPLDEAEGSLKESLEA